jgi:hypothetical protein
MVNKRQLFKHRKEFVPTLGKPMLHLVRATNLLSSRVVKKNPYAEL